MKTIIAGFIAVLAAVLPVVAQAQQPSTNPPITENRAQAGQVVQSAAGANGNGSTFPTFGLMTLTMQNIGTFSATINPEGSLDGGTTWAALTCFPTGSVSAATTMTTTGIWRCNIVGIPLLRARISGWASGSVTTRFFATNVPFNTGTNAQ